MKPAGRIGILRMFNVILWALTLFVVVWISKELGFLRHGSLSATETGSKASDTKMPTKTAERVEDLDIREEVLRKKERELGDREILLKEQVRRYEKLIAGLQSRVSDLEKNQSERMEQFMSIFEKMDPKKAARIFDEMNILLSSHILSSMKQDRAAEILSRMSSDRARLVAERFLGKNNKTPKRSLTEE